MKEKHIPRRTLTSSFKFLLLLAAFELIGCLYFFMNMITTQPITLRPSLVPTAQYLLENPRPTPNNIYIMLRYNTYENYPASHQPDSEICYSYLQEVEAYDPSLSYIVVDTYPLSSRSHPNGGSGELSRPNPHTYCVDRSLLSSGLHLVELHLKREQGDTPYVYQAAIVIED